jgi:hypothetical protein
VDSIYNSGRINYTENRYRNSEAEKVNSTEVIKDTSFILNKKNKIGSKEIGLEHQLFFSSNPLKNTTVTIPIKSEEFIYAKVDGEQMVMVNSRLRMRLVKEAVIDGLAVKKNSLIYGFIRFQPNRAIIEIENINQQPVKLKAYDLQDGSEGIYVENSFRADATREVIGDVVDEINIAGVPQLGGIKKIFQKNNKNIKVTITNNYKLILKQTN